MEPDEPLDDFIITASALRPLLAFSHMESLSIDVMASFEDVDNAQLREVALAFPHLWEIGLGSIFPWARPREQTYSVSFPLQSKQLRAIGLSIDATVVGGLPR